MPDTEIWALVLRQGHWDHGGWTADGRDGLVICACGEEITDEAGDAAA